MSNLNQDRFGDPDMEQTAYSPFSTSINWRKRP